MAKIQKSFSLTGSFETLISNFDKFLKAGIALIALSLFLAPTSFAAEDFYNEVFDSSGAIRPQYREVYDTWQKLSDKQKQDFLVESKRVFRGDNALDSMARVLTHDEMIEVRAGVEQRGTALREFLKDLQSSRPRIFEEHPEIKKTVNRIALRSGELLFKGKLNPDSISFLYGPDLIRDVQGNWLVIEDNLGYVGGIGDLKLAQKHYFNQFPELRSKLSIESTENFYDDLFRALHTEARKNQGRLVYYTYPMSMRADNEDKRLIALLDEYGVESVSATTPRKIRVKPDGVYVGTEKEFRLGQEEKVGYLFLMAEPTDFDGQHPAVKMSRTIKTLSELIKDPKVLPARRSRVQGLLQQLETKSDQKLYASLERIAKRYKPAVFAETDEGLTGLTKAIEKGQVGSNYSAGIDFVTDKEFYLLVDDLVRFYLNEEPLLKNIPTRSFYSQAAKGLNQDVFDSVFSTLTNFVIKRVDGRGGDAVWVGSKIKAEEAEQLKKKIAMEPSAFIAQKYVSMPRLNELIVDFRFLAQVFPDKVVSSAVPFGRGLPIDGNGKVNLSDTGREITVLVLQKDLVLPNQCTALF